VFGTHFGRKVAEIEPEEEEALHVDKQIPQHPHQTFVARKGRESNVKVEVAIEKLDVRVPVVIGVLGCGEDDQTTDVLGRRPLAGELDGSSFKSEPEVKAISNVSQRNLVHHVPAIGATQEEALLIKPPAGLAHRNPAGAVEARELVLGQRGARTVPQGDDVALEGAVHLFGRRSSFRRRNRGLMGHHIKSIHIVYNLQAAIG
jgi:hypothetical protein